MDYNWPPKRLSNFFQSLKLQSCNSSRAMDVADDVILRDSRRFELEDRCKLELALLAAIDKATVESKSRRKLLRQIMEGADLTAIKQDLDEHLNQEPT